MAGGVGYTYDRRFLLHDTGVDEIRLPSGAVLDPEPHPSSVRIARRTAQLLEHSGILNDTTSLPARAAKPSELELVHDPAYVERVRKIADRGGGLIHADTPISARSWDAVVLAAGTAINLVDFVLDGVVTRAFGLVRPPGHHATASAGMGYSIFNNVAMAALHAKRVRGIGRVAIVDWDVHSASGTAEIFWDDPEVLVVSLHQDAWYPIGTGATTEVGGAGAEGSTVNIPLPPGTGDQGYALAFERVVEPLLLEFGPDLVLVSAGHDASMVDPLGRMLLTTDGFRAMASRIAAIADATCGGRLVALTEGGYSAGYVPFCTLATLEGLVGVRTEVSDPLAGIQRDRAALWFDERQEAAVEEVRRVHAPYWRALGRSGVQ